MKRDQFLRQLTYVIISFGTLVLLWQIVNVCFPINDALFPSPRKVGEAFLELETKGLGGSMSQIQLHTHIGISLLRFFVGYLASVVLGVLFGLLLGCCPKLFRYLNPVLQLVRPIAPVAWMPFVVLWVGIGNTPAIIIIFIAGFFPVVLSTVHGVQTIDVTYIKVARNFDISKRATVCKIIFPAIFSQISNGVHLALGTAWIFLVSGEMVGAQSGLGFLVMDAKNCLRSDALLATMITIGIIGLLLDLGLRRVELLLAKNYGLGMAQVVRED